CSKALSSKQSLSDHELRHAGTQRYECEEPGCGQLFALSSNLSVHMRSHAQPLSDIVCVRLAMLSLSCTSERTHDKTFACTETGCGKRFARSDAPADARAHTYGGAVCVRLAGLQQTLHHHLRLTLSMFTSALTAGWIYTNAATRAVSRASNHEAS
ncbi:hypothetical protein V8E36_005017, partial [Tilletia maclaganii]